MAVKNIGISSIDAEDGKSNFAEVGIPNKMYIDELTGIVYRWDVPSQTYVEIKADLANFPTDAMSKSEYDPANGNKQVAFSDDARFSDSRPASDVYAWAKATTKPTYTYTEVGADQSGTASTAISSHESTYNHSNITHANRTALDSVSGINTGDQDISGKLDKNTPITGATKTKITYDSKGLITSGADATTSDIADSTDKRYCTDAQKTVIGNTSGTNTGDETASTIKTKLGITTLSGSNTGDETASTIKTKLGITTLSGSNTGDETQATIKTKLGAATGSVDGYITAANFTSFFNKMNSSLANGKIWIGGTGGTAAAQSVTGDLSITNAGVTTVGDTASTANKVCKRDASGNGFFKKVISQLGSTPSMGPELITNASDRNFTSLVNWSGVDWNIVDGKYVYTGTTGESATLNAYPSAAEKVYLLRIVVGSDRDGAISFSYGGDIVYHRTKIGEEYLFLQIDSNSVSNLTISPWDFSGYIKDVSIVEFIKSTETQLFLDDNGTPINELRSWSSCLGIGKRALAYSQQLSYLSSIAIGEDALMTDQGGENVAIGFYSLRKNYGGSLNVAIGTYSLEYARRAGSCVAIGAYALGGSSHASLSIAIGNGANYSDNGVGNIAVGISSAQYQTTGNNNTVVGSSSFGTNYGSDFISSENTVIGSESMTVFNSGDNNTSLGSKSLSLLETGSLNTALGHSSLASSVNVNNSTGIGANSEVTGDNQVQLGDSSTTVYAYGTVQNRSDERDKTEIRNTELGLEFINKLRPVDFKWDMREDYREPMPIAPSIKKPIKPKIGASEQEISDYNTELAEYNSILRQYKLDIDAWYSRNNISNLAHDGSKTRNRFHHGLIAQEVLAVMNELGIDFGGYQDHSLKGGDDVKSIGYGELIGPMIKAIQELTVRVQYLEGICNPK